MTLFLGGSGGYATGSALDFCGLRMCIGANQTSCY